jgi:molybdopterin converting factor small subunit
VALRGDEVATSIDKHVRETIEKLVAEMRSSIEDVREAVDQQLRAALQSMQADVNSVRVLPHIQKSITDLEHALTGAAPAPRTTADAGRVKRAVQAVEHGTSQVDILNALLEQAIEFGSRAALLILRGETFSGWKGMGFSAHGGNDEAVKRFNAAPGLIAELDRVLRDEHVVMWDGASLASRFGVGAPARAILVPMVIKDKVAAAVYVDAVGSDVSKLDPASLELLVFTTGLLIDTLAIRKKIPSPSLNEPAGAAFSQPAAVAAPRPAAAAPKAAPAPTSSTVAISSSQIREAMAAKAPTFSGTVAVPSSPPPAAKLAPPPPPKSSGFATTAIPPLASQRSAGGALGGEERASTQFIPQAGLSRPSASGGAPTEESKKHDEARRFARLLVSEIKLYNESKVEQGRKNKDLYERLKEDIDRSRQMYDERISQDVRKASNYFYDELVRILADGDAGTLGL